MRFRNRNDACEAIRRGNDDPDYPEKLDLCFGERRNFCKQKYTDLGKRHANIDKTWYLLNRNNPFLPEGEAT